MDTADKGEVLLDGQHIESLDETELTTYRRYDVGFVFQFYNLVQNLTALENVELASEICDDPMDPEDVLASVGLEDRMDNFPAQLSGGEQQRVAIARAVAKNPKILLCDEPTGALDYNTGKTILRLLHDLCKQTGKTVIVITHNQALKAMADRVILVKNGQAVQEEINQHPEPIENIEW
jgi:putative ABC transport system ATP-binding protein